MICLLIMESQEMSMSHDNNAKPPNNSNSRLRIDLHMFLHALTTFAIIFIAICVAVFLIRNGSGQAVPVCDCPTKSNPQNHDYNVALMHRQVSPFVAHFEFFTNQSILGTKSATVAAKRVKVAKSGFEVEIEPLKFELPANATYDVQFSNLKGSPEAMAYLNDVRLPSTYTPLQTTSSLKFEIKCGRDAHGQSKFKFCEVYCNPCIATLKYS